jgi:acetyl esterase/lipase
MDRASILALCCFLTFAGEGNSQQTSPPFTIEQTVAARGFDGEFCWVHARAGAMPAAGQSDPTVVMTLQKLQLSGSDIFFALNEMRTSDGGKSWTRPVEHKSFARVPFEFDGHKELEVTVCDFSPKWHAKTGKLLGTGHTVVYENNHVRRVRPRGTAYAVYDPDNAGWSPWRTIEMPDEAKFQNAGAGSVQRVDLANGDVLLPIYFKVIGKTQYATTVLRCEFDGETLRYREHGSELTVPVKRGLYEPSLAEFGGRYFLTMRNDDHGYVSVSEGRDSLNFSPPKKWTFDDGSDLGNYNTQQHWVRHPRHGLWLVYTRKGAGNDHVFRHRAPVFIAKVDPEKLHIIRSTEQILVPEKGARLGNFGVTEISENETWVTAAEWMQGPGPNYHDPRPLVARGADNRIWVAKVNWTSPPAPVIQRHGDSFNRSAVLVDNAALAHTTQLIAGDGNTASLDQEIRDVFDRLSAALRDVDSSKKDLVKLNLYVADEQTAKAAMTFLADWCAADSRPAVCAVATVLPQGRRFAVDAIFVVRQADAGAKVKHRFVTSGTGKASSGKADVSVLPKGDVVYVSGQAQPGDDLAIATNATLQGLLQTLEGLSLGRADIVQVKCFLEPMSKVETVNREINAFFDDETVPAVSHVEWIRGGGSRPIEIELVAAAPLTQTTETVSYYTPPGMKASPVFSRVARIHGNRRIYVSGLIASDSEDGVAQVDSVFQQLIRQLKPTRSNLRHLAKATYYVADGDVSSQLNNIRPHYYDPKRPPAASKATVRGTGFTDRTIAVDLIAAPESPLISVLTPIAKKAKFTRRVIYKTVGDRKLHLHIFEPEGHQPTDRRPVFLAIHGGGWTGGNAPGFYPFAEHFAEQGMVGISLEYRLRNPRDATTVFDCVRDARSAVRWIRKNATDLGIDPAKIVAMGGSAGGHLAVSTALFDRVNEDSDPADVSARPDALILMYPVIDTSTDGYGQAKIGDRWRELSPVHNVRGGLPPALIFHGTADTVTPYIGARSFHDQSIAAGNTSTLITHPGGRHGYIIFDRDEYDHALMQMREFLRQQRLLPSVAP